MIPKWIARFRAKMQNIEHVDIDPKGLKISQASTELHLPLPDDYKGHKNCKSKAHKWAKAKMEFGPQEEPGPHFHTISTNATQTPQRMSFFDLMNWRKAAGHMLWLILLSVFMVQVIITITKPQQEKEIITAIDYNQIGEINKQYQILEDLTEIQKQIINDPDLANYKKEIIDTTNGKTLNIYEPAMDI